MGDLRAIRRGVLPGSGFGHFCHDRGLRNFNPGGSALAPPAFGFLFLPGLVLLSSAGDAVALLPALIPELPDLPAPLGKVFPLGFVHRFELEPCVLGGHQLVKPGRVSSLDPPVLVRPGIEGIQGGEGARRTGFLVVAVIRKVVLRTALPTVVIPVRPALMRINRIIPVAPGIVAVGSVITGPAVLRSVVVAEIIMTAPGPEEQMVQQGRDADHRGGAVVIIRAGIIAPGEADRGKDHAAARDVVIIVAIHIDVAQRSPGVIGRHPHPVRTCQIPVARLPDVPRLAPAPCSWNPRVIPGGGTDVGAGLKAGWRFVQVFDFLGGGIRPVTGDPLVILAGLPPIARNPLPPRRKIAPDTTDPKKFTGFIIPGPVAGDPRHIGPLRALIRRDFLHFRGWGFRHHQSRGGFIDDGSCEGLVHGPPGQDFCVLVVYLLRPAGRHEAQPAG